MLCWMALVQQTTTRVVHKLPEPVKVPPMDKATLLRKQKEAKEAKKKAEEEEAMARQKRAEARAAKDAAKKGKKLPY